MARKFLYLMAFLIVLAIGALFALRMFPDKLAEAAFVPTAEFVEQDPLAANAYRNPAMWFSRPGMDAADDPARWQPSLAAPEAGESDAATPEPEGTPAAPAPDQPAPGMQDHAVFFVHPTSHLNRSNWNAPLDDTESQDRARLFVQGMASPFASARQIWAPRYRQATFGAFLTSVPEAQMAIEAAYRDIEEAFDVFLEEIGPGTPIVLAGHSQGALHVLRLLRERVAGTPLQERIAMAYPIGWPISMTHDLPELGLPVCETADQGGCIVSWASFAEPAEPGRWLDQYRDSAGLNGELRGDSRILCVNPISGVLDGEAEASANLGTLVPNAALTDGELIPGAVPARCDERGMLLIGSPPDLGPYVLPGNNFHVYDIPLFWANLRQDVNQRVSAWAANR